MNMMLVSVRERTREIGIRKSVGADPWRVQSQFLIEAGILSTLGGITGIAVGITATRVIATSAGSHPIISGQSILIAFAVAITVGLFFGYYPARRASRLDPISALRHE